MKLRLRKMSVPKLGFRKKVQQLVKHLTERIIIRPAGDYSKGVWRHNVKLQRIVDVRFK